MTVRTRFAPSPTGFVHIGSLRTALYSYLFARKHGGQFLLRVEDTDQSRFVEGAVENMVRSLAWAGIVADEGVTLTQDRADVMQKGDCGPYIQSERLAIYQAHAQKLLISGHAYRCFCSKERLEKMRTAQQEAKQAPMYDGHCRMLSQEESAARAAAGESHVIRLNVPRFAQDPHIVKADLRRPGFSEGPCLPTVPVVDLVRGTVHVALATIDDQVLVKSDGFPTYHLAVVVDDHMMRITHVIRGEEWLPSTPKHILLYHAFGWEQPQWAHIPLLLNPDKSKLSKRQGDVAVEDYIAKGFLPEALINFVALLGWNPGKGETQEIFTMQELIARFDLAQVHKAGAVCDLARLRWFNAQHIKRMTPGHVLTAAMPFLVRQPFYAEAADQYTTDAHLLKVAVVVQERLEILADFGVEQAGYFFARPLINPQLLTWKDADVSATRAALDHARDILTALDAAAWTREQLAATLMQAAGADRGAFLWPLRAALTGVERSPSPMDCAWVLGREEVLARIAEAVDALER